MRVKTWKILDMGTVPEGAPTIDFPCPRCRQEAALPIRGRPVALSGDGVVFDTDGPYAMPATIQCRRCGRILENVR